MTLMNLVLGVGIVVRSRDGSSSGVGSWLRQDYLSSLGRSAALSVCLGIAAEKVRGLVVFGEINSWLDWNKDTEHGRLESTGAGK